MINQTPAKNKKLSSEEKTHKFEIEITSDQIKIINQNYENMAFEDALENIIKEKTLILKSKEKIKKLVYNGHSPPRNDVLQNLESIAMEINNKNPNGEILISNLKLRIKTALKNPDRKTIDKYFKSILDFCPRSGNGFRLDTFDLLNEVQKLWVKKEQQN